MPVYEYFCADCETKFEALRPMSKINDPIQCKNCESMHTARALSLFATHVKDKNGSSSASTSQSHGCGGCSGGACGNCHH